MACSAHANCSASTFLANTTVGAGGGWARAENLTASPFDGCWADLLGTTATTAEPGWWEYPLAPWVPSIRLSGNGECDEGGEGAGICPWGSDAADCSGACFLHAAGTLNRTETPDAVACLQPVQIASESRAWLENLIGSGTIWLRGLLAMKVVLPYVLTFLFAKYCSGCPGGGADESDESSGSAVLAAALDRGAAAREEAAAEEAAAEEAARDHARAKCQAKAGWAVIVIGVDPAKKALRVELSASKLSQLKKRASEAGVSEEDLDDADDTDDTDAIKTAVIDLILTAEMPEGTEQGLLHEELSALKVSALKQRAVAAGVGAHALEEADDADDKKGTLVQLILARQPPVATAWAEAHRALGMKQRPALREAAVRLVAWHWSQPAAYFWVAAVYFCQLSDEGDWWHSERKLASVVAAREVIYVLSTLFACGVCPEFLLLDLWTVWHEETRALARLGKLGIYVLAPHHYVTACLLRWAQARRGAEGARAELLSCCFKPSGWRSLRRLGQRGRPGNAPAAAGAARGAGHRLLAHHRRARGGARSDCARIARCGVDGAGCRPYIKNG